MGAGSDGKSRSKGSAPYVRALAVRYAQLTRQSYIKGATAKKIFDRLPPFEDFHINWTPPMEPEWPLSSTRLRPTREGNSSSSAGASSSSSAPAASAVDEENILEVEELSGTPPTPVASEDREEVRDLKDYWVETPTFFIRYHVKPRQHMFTPLLLAEAENDKDRQEYPRADELTPDRWTACIPIGGKKVQLRKDTWIGDKTAAALKAQWTGRTLFKKKKPTVADPAAEAASAAATPGITNLSASMSVLRKELHFGQRADPLLKEIIAKLEKQPAKSYLAAPQADGKKVAARAEHFALASHGVLVAMVGKPATELLVIPNVTYDGKEQTANKPKNMSWKHLILASVHNTATGPHRRAQEMYYEIHEIIYWHPTPEHLRRDCETWCQRCKVCVSIHGRTLGARPLRPILEYRPFYRMQYDLMEVRPKGDNGETHILTCICVASRYSYLRNLSGREATGIAQALLDIILDCGIVPAILQSDNEFATLILEELVSLLGSTQIFSTALRPESQGIAERSHRTIRATLATCIETLCRAAPRKWPMYTRWAEYKLRHATLCMKNSERITPYRYVHGFAGSTSLKSAMQAIKEIPESVITTEWLSAIVQESSQLAGTVIEFRESEAAKDTRKHEEKVSTKQVREGDLVLLQKPFFEKGAGLILPGSDGPYRVTKVYDDHLVQLADVLTGTLVQRGKPISKARIILFHYLGDLAKEDLTEEDMTHDYQIGNMVAAEIKIAGQQRVCVCRVEKLFEVGAQAELTVFEVPNRERYGPWVRRPWHVRMVNEAVHREQVPLSEIICPVDLREQALTADSVEQLSKHGVNVDIVGKEKSFTRT